MTETAAPRAGRRPKWLAGLTGTLLLPLLAVLVILIVVPVLAMFYGAVGGWDRKNPGIRFDALLEVVADPEYLWTYAGTIGLSLLIAAIAVVVGAAFAWILARTDVRWRGAFELGVIAPLFLSPFIGAVAWIMLAAPNSGMINVNLRHIFGPDFTLLNVMSVPGMVWVLSIYYIPYGYLMVAAALRNMDPSLEDASYVNGHGHFRTIMTVTLPVIRPAMTAAFFFVAVLTTGVFSVPGVLAVNDFVPIAVRIYRAATVYPTDLATASALGTVLFVVTVIGIFFYRNAVKQTARFVTVTSRGFRPRLIRLGKWRGVAQTVLVIYFVVTVVMPYAAITLVAFTPYAQTDFAQMQFSFKSFLSVVTSGRVATATLNTVILGVLAPTVSVLLGLLIGFAVQRRRGRLAAVIDYLATLPVAIPGIVLATGMVGLYIRTPIYATIWLLLVAFVASYIPHATRLSSNGLVQIDKSLEEAAYVNGARWPKALRTITLPLAKPSLLSAWIMVFIFATREINSTIILYSPRSTVLSVLTWDYIGNGGVPQAAAVGLLQTLILIVGIVVARFVFKVRLSSAV